MSSPVIVFVPGAFLGPGPYAAVADALREKKHSVDVVNLPSAADLSADSPLSPKWKELASKTVDSDVQAIRDTLEPHFQEGNEVVLIGHSYGSIPAMLSTEGQTSKERKEQGLKGGVVGYINESGFAFAARGKNAMGTDDDPPLMPYHKFDVSSDLLS